MRLMFARALTVALAVLGGAAAMAFPKLDHRRGRA